MLSPSFDELPPPVNPGSRYGFKLHTERWLIFGIAMALNFANSMYSTTFVDLKPRMNETDGYFCNGTINCNYLDSIVEFSYAGIFMLAVYPSILFCLKLKLKRTVSFQF
uniref:Uncharacterized protein n=1 Tax=Panagrolaimus sp. PS1159 TaxID=55785 RepID=A0AC35EV91_9BILA